MLAVQVSSHVYDPLQALFKILWAMPEIVCPVAFFPSLHLLFQTDTNQEVPNVVPYVTTGGWLKSQTWRLSKPMHSLVSKAILSVYCFNSWQHGSVVGSAHGSPRQGSNSGWVHSVWSSPCGPVGFLRHLPTIHKHASCVNWLVQMISSYVCACVALRWRGNLSGVYPAFTQHQLG